MTLSRPFLSTLCTLTALAGLLLAGCSDQAAAPADTAAAPAPQAASTPAKGGPGAQPPVSVTTVRALQRDMAVNLKTTGTVVSLSSVDVKSQITSTLRQVHFREGQFVKAGQLLFTLDARTEEANLAKTRAQLAKDTVSLNDARRQWQRAKQLLAQKFVSQGALDTALAEVDAWQATLASDQAAITASQVALSYARITAPQAGRAGAVNVFAGSAVLANQTPLVTITQLDPIGVAFSIAQRDLSSALAALKDGGAVVTAVLADKGGSFQGRLQFMDNLVDASSGTVMAKANFANPGSKLWPGAFVEVSQTVATLSDVVVVPQVSVIQGPRGTFVYVIADGVASMRPVKLLYAEGADAAIEGVKPGEEVALDGRQNLRPNASVVVRAPQGAASGGKKAGQP
ncbi:efflux RND transporter periplasmic adaptor subunit [Rhodoferax antarcticus]|uniref:Efflux transporter, RND family, MFP subunit n=1 Tax=Rhodoferax antarcticus ANT.BR TaxID=1111071 RepID=A0A1Q8YJT9_9BURK|nr:efflux RND transporter periplasmic adaptor subunit [Rhodoferax antarcticus]OLP08217.1 efflux transporter, RND family, MFP subunit [Rhodoferax antarcticus ANT.BR]